MQTSPSIFKNQSYLSRLLLILSLGLQTANAATLIDDFDDKQKVLSTSQPTSGPISISSTDLSGLARSLSITSSDDEDDSAKMSSKKGFLIIGSDAGTASNANIYYNFAGYNPLGMNLASIADVLVFDIASIDIGTQIRIIANGTSEYLFQSISLAGQYAAPLLSFSQPNVFGSLHNLEIQINSLVDTDLKLDRISAIKTSTTSSVPEPSSLALVVIGVLTLIRYRALPVRAYL